MKTCMLILMICLIGCSSRVSKEQQNTFNDTIKPAYSGEKTPKAKEKIDSNIHTFIQGIWTDGTTENATFEINKDSIYYVDQFESYKYTVAREIIKIDYPDFAFIGQIRFSNDTLILTSEGDTTKYWRFRK